MPIYAYKCGSCGLSRDVLQRISDAPLSVCPACGESTFTKQVTAAGFQLKGSGWYATDFKGAKKVDNNDADGKKGGKDDDKSGGKTDSKSDGKIDSKSDASSSTKSGTTSDAKTSTSSDASSKSAKPAAAGGCGASCGCH